MSSAVPLRGSSPLTRRGAAWAVRTLDLEAMHFSKPPTRFEWALAIHLIALLMVGFGVAGLVVAHRAAPEKEALALALEHRALWSLGLGLGLVLVFWVVRRFTN